MQMRLAALLLCVMSSSSAFAAGADAGRLRDAAARNLALFQQSQKHWFEVQRCDSCHHQYQPALAYRAAREHGIPFDESIARADAAKARSEERRVGKECRSRWSPY